MPRCSATSAGRRAPCSSPPRPRSAQGFCLTSRRTRRLGGALLAATSAAILLSELEHNDPIHARPRAAVFLAGLAALLMPGRRRATL